MKFLLLYIILAMIVMSLLTAKGVNLSYDSKRYLLAGDCVAHGAHKEAMDNIFPHHAPLYSFALGWLQKHLYGGKLNTVGFNPMSQPIARKVPWARLICVLGFVSTVALIFLLGWYVGGSVAAHFCALLTLPFAPILRVFTWAWSETLFLPLSLLCLLSLLRYSKKQNLAYLLVAALCAGGAFLTRFIGFTLIVVGLLCLLCWVKKDRKVLYSLPLWMAVSVLPMLLYWGLDRGSPTPGWGPLRQAWTFLAVSSWDLSSVGFLLLFVVAFLRIRVSWILGLYLGIYLGALLIAMSVSAVNPVDRVDSRLLVPIYPVLLVYLACGLSTLLKTKEVPLREKQSAGYSLWLKKSQSS